MNKNVWLLAAKLDYVNKAPTTNSPSYRFLDAFVSDDMAKDALVLPRRKPVYISWFAKKLKVSEDVAYQKAEEMARAGLIEWCWDDNGKEMIKMPLFAPGSMEQVLMRQDITPEQEQKVGRAFFDEAHFLTELLSPMVPNGHGLIKALPVQKAIENDPKKVDIDTLDYWINKYDGHLSKAVCQCRRGAIANNEGGEEPAEEWCIQLGQFADQSVKFGRATRITKEEAYEICDRAEELGFVHEVTNIDGAENSMFICNCEWDTCLALRTGWWCGTPSMTRSNYTASVDPSHCVACGQCVEVCPQNSVRLGEKLCQKNPVEIKDAPLPEYRMWKKEYWHNDFQTTRKNVYEETGTAPCKTACPAHIAVQGYLKLAAQGKYTEALDLIRKENPFPAVCGAICNHRCEDECTRGSVDNAVAIDDVKRFIAEHELANGYTVAPRKMYADGKKIAIIGGGPAGLSCAYYLAQYGHDVTVFEKEEKMGGMMTYGIPNFRMDKKLLDKEIEIIKGMGVEFRNGVEVGKDITIADLRKEGFKGFYLAIGAQNGRSLGLANEDAEGVQTGVDFLRKAARKQPTGVTGKTVVIGGGNVAIDVARTAVRQGASEVALYCLESADEMPAALEEQIDAKEEGVAINNGWGPKEILVKDGKVSGIVLKKCTAVFDKDHRFNPQYDENDTITVEADTLLLSIGQSIAWGDLLKGEDVELNRNGTVKADAKTYITSKGDIFVGGDVYTGPKFCIDAIAAGKEGAVSLNRAVRKGHSLVIGRDNRDFKAIDKDNALIELGYDKTPRQVPQKVLKERPDDTPDYLALTQEQVAKETARCLSCGAARVDERICIGCGLCTTRCKFDAIHLTKRFETRGCTYEELIPQVIKNVGVIAKNIATGKTEEDLFDARNWDTV